MIAITGIGIVSPIGIGKNNVLDSLLRSISGVSASENFRLPRSNITKLGEIKDFIPKKYIPPMKARRMSRFSHLGLASAIEAVADSGIELSESNCFTTGIALGTGLASTDSTDKFYEGLLREGPEGTNPIIFPETVQNIAASHISIHFGIKGPNITFSHSDISSELALFYGCELLRDGLVDLVIAAGADELSIAAVAGYSSLGLLSQEMMPFDVRRDGFVLSEGGAAVVLERLEDAKKRNAHIYCTVAASAFSSFPASTIQYDRSCESMKHSMENAVSNAGIEHPDFISASANSTKDLDRLETAAIKDVFGSRASSIPVSAFRSFYGFFPGDGMFRIAAAAVCIKEGIIPATLGLQIPSPECDLDYVTDGPRKTDIYSVMINSFSSGGSAAAIVLKRGK